jgi:hypothetical protein
MATKAFHIEVRVQGVDSADRMQALIEAVQAAGRQLHAAATLICGDHAPPEIMLYGEDFVEGRTDIKLGA